MACVGEVGTEFVHAPGVDDPPNFPGLYQLAQLSLHSIVGCVQFQGQLLWCGATSFQRLFDPISETVRSCLWRSALLRLLVNLKLNTFHSLVSLSPLAVSVVFDL